MIKPASVTCDECGTEQKQANGWRTLMPMVFNGVAGVLVLPVATVGLQCLGMVHCCGDTCLSRHMMKLSAEGQSGNRENPSQPGRE